MFERVSEGWTKKGDEVMHRLHPVRSNIDIKRQYRPPSTRRSASACVWCGVVWCGVVWCGVVWCGVVWCGVVWCGVV